MGFWNLIKNINKAEGVREAMRMSYDKHFRLAQQPDIFASGTQSHEAGLFGALASRLRLSGVSIGSITDWRSLIGKHITSPSAEVRVYAELMPFLYLEPTVAREALAEYVVYKEMPLDANRKWLSEQVRKGLSLIGEDEYKALMIAMLAKVNKFAWTELTGK
jgi:hypothetical protein